MGSSFKDKLISDGSDCLHTKVQYIVYTNEYGCPDCGVCVSAIDVAKYPDQFTTNSKIFQAIVSSKPIKVDASSNTESWLKPKTTYKDKIKFGPVKAKKKTAKKKKIKKKGKVIKVTPPSDNIGISYSEGVKEIKWIYDKPSMSAHNITMDILKGKAPENWKELFGEHIFKEITSLSKSDNEKDSKNE